MTMLHQGGIWAGQRDRPGGRRWRLSRGRSEPAPSLAFAIRPPVFKPNWHAPCGRRRRLSKAG